ncbi:hypothetical protein EVJ58_g10931 [Rhodofomes roseus]|uniref:Uncharacterized protein n=1 Tax=Rhodofomes roseus TaxID=34475 RepID=A0A4Y9XLU2_9APHY|nr:hypothetical protein EVJ58_g10931 [Rhodofomes roseus]
MVGPWTYEDTGKYYREAVKRRPSFSGRRDMLQFTDRLPSTDNWTLPVLLQLNRTLRVLYNGPFNWDAFKKIVMQHILTDDVLDALKALPEDEQIPHLVQLVLDWACWDTPKEGAWPRDLSMRRYFVKWRRCEPFHFEADTHTDEDMERAADLFLDIWMGVIRGINVANRLTTQTTKMTNHQDDHQGTRLEVHLEVHLGEGEETTVMNLMITDHPLMEEVLEVREDQVVQEAQEVQENLEEAVIMPVPEDVVVGKTIIQMTKVSEKNPALTLN